MPRRSRALDWRRSGIASRLLKDGLYPDSLDELEDLVDGIIAKEEVDEAEEAEEAVSIGDLWTIDGYSKKGRSVNRKARSKRKAVPKQAKPKLTVKEKIAKAKSRAPQRRLRIGRKWDF